MTDEEILLNFLSNIDFFIKENKHIHLEKENALAIKDSIKALLEQTEKMKCCANCIYCDYDEDAGYMFCNMRNKICIDYDKWKLRSN